MYNHHMPIEVEPITTSLYLSIVDFLTIAFEFFVTVGRLVD